jgi:hypothetical protein
LHRRLRRACNGKGRGFLMSFVIVSRLLGQCFWHRIIVNFFGIEIKKSLAPFPNCRELVSGLNSQYKGSKYLMRFSESRNASAESSKNIRLIFGLEGDDSTAQYGSTFPTSCVCFDILLLHLQSLLAFPTSCICSNIPLHLQSLSTFPTLCICLDVFLPHLQLLLAFPTSCICLDIYHCVCNYFLLFQPRVSA